MARTFEIACTDCAVTLWIGQRPTGAERWYLYGAPNYTAALEDFLMAHKGHALLFDDSEVISLRDYKSLDDDEE